MSSGKFRLLTIICLLILVFQTSSQQITANQLNLPRLNSFQTTIFGDAGKASIWVFKMSKNADLDKLVNSYGQDQKEGSRAYSNFFKLMINVEEKIREEVVFV